MRVYKATYKDRDGKQRKTAKWYIDLSDHNQLRHKIPAFADKRLSEAFGRNIESLVNCRLSGLEPDVKLNQWIETLPDSLLKKFVSWGLLDGQRTEITKPLKEHIREYVKTLEAKGYSKGYIRHTKNRLKKITSDCRLYYFRDITKSAIEIYIGKLIKNNDVSPTTAGHYLDSLKTFLNWAQLDQRIINNPIATVAKPARESKRKGVLTPEQFIRLVKNTFEKNILIGRITGQERAVLYLLAGTTGLRKTELLSLVWNDINTSDSEPFVRVRACIAKNGKETLQPLTTMSARLLTSLKDCTRPKDSDRVFSAFNKTINTADLIRNDLEAADIPLRDRDGNEIVFHSLRNSFISFLANSQTPAKVIQKMARHSDPKLTFNTYARVLPEAEQKAISFLPNFGNFVLSTSLDKNCTKQEIYVDSYGQENSQDALKTAILAVEETPRVGLEPTT